MKVVKSKQAKKYIESQDQQTQDRLNAAINKLPEGDVVPITGMPDTFRLRVGKYRALFIKENDMIKVTVINTRGQIY